jgi:hypothetical protein
LLLSGFDTRTDAFLTKIRNGGLYPVEAPDYSRRGGLFTNEIPVTITHASPVYYTVDGSDPRHDYVRGYPASSVQDPAALRRRCPHRTVLEQPNERE